MLAQLVHPPKTMVVSAAAALLLLTGCGSSSTASSSAATPGNSTPSTPSTPSAGATDTTGDAPTAADGLVHVVDSTNGFSLELPAGWVVAPDASRSAPLSISGPVGKKVEPKFAATAEQSYAAGAKLLAIEPGAKEFGTNVNVIVQPSGGFAAKDIMLLVPSVKKELAALKTTSFTSKAVTLGGQPAAQMDYTYPLASNGFPIAARVIYAIHNGNAYIVTISRDAKLSVASTDTVANSIRLG